MPRTRIVHRSDENADAIVQALRSVGATVEYLSGKGVPDLLVGYNGMNVLMEIKSARGDLNDDQEGWHERWEGQVCVVRTIGEAFQAIGLQPEAA